MKLFSNISFPDVLNSSWVLCKHCPASRTGSLQEWPGHGKACRVHRKLRCVSSATYVSMSLGTTAVTLDAPDIRRPGYVITLVADVLAPNRRQAISNHPADSTIYTVTWAILRDTDIMLQPLNKQCSREVGRSATRWFLCYWRVRLVTAITRNGTH